MLSADAGHGELSMVMCVYVAHNFLFVGISYMVRVPCY